MCDIDWQARTWRKEVTTNAICRLCLEKSGSGMLQNGHVQERGDCSLGTTTAPSASESSGSDEDHINGMLV